jgi:hypothetical protein
MNNENRTNAYRRARFFTGMYAACLIILTGILVIVAIYRIKLSNDSAILEKRGVRAVATVLKTEGDRVVVSMPLPGGPENVTIDRLGSQLCPRAYQWSGPRHRQRIPVCGSIPQDMPITLVYDPQNPSRAMPPEVIHTGYGSVVGCAIAALFFGLLSFFFVRKFFRVRVLRRPDAPTTTMHVVSVQRRGGVQRLVLQAPDGSAIKMSTLVVYGELSEDTYVTAIGRADRPVALELTNGTVIMPFGRVRRVRNSAAVTSPALA